MLVYWLAMVYYYSQINVNNLKSVVIIAAAFLSLFTTKAHTYVYVASYTIRQTVKNIMFNSFMNLSN